MVKRIASMPREYEPWTVEFIDTESAEEPEQAPEDALEEDELEDTEKRA